MSGPEVEMLVGLLDLNHIVDVQARSKGRPIQLRPEVTHRFMMSIRGFAVLKQQIEEISRRVEELTGSKLDLALFESRTD
jgi:hypothetical protein